MFEGRKLLFKAQVGSHNYNLNTEESDKDLKYFVAPTFDDLYDKKMFTTSKVGEKVDYTVHDIRKLPEMLWKANINFIEILFSCSFMINDDGMMKINSMAEEIARMNIPHLFSACKGMYYQKISQLEKGTQGTQHLVEKYGYDTKQALHAVRVLDVFMRYASTDFQNFRYAIKYSDGDRERLLSIKHGKYSLQEFKDYSSEIFEKFMAYEKIAKSYTPDEKLYGYINDLIRKSVKDNIKFQ